MSVNKVILLGRLGADPEVRMTAGGTQVAIVSLATSEKFKDRNGEMKETTEWHRCVLWEKKAELASKYLRKGSLVYFEGKIKTRSWDDQSGQKRYTTEIIVDTISFCDSARGGQQGESSAPHQANYGAPSQEAAQGYGDEDVPF